MMEKPASSDAKKHRKRSRPDKRLFQTYVESFRQKKKVRLVLLEELIRKVLHH
jgi:hypothetical protein